VRAPLQSLPLLWMGLNLVKLVTALLGGRLADRWGRRGTVASGWLVFIVCYVGFAFAETQFAVVLLFLLYGAHHGLSEAAEKSLVASLVPARARGTGFGWYHLVSGLIALAASVLFGGLWQAFGSRSAFLTSACLATVALALLPLVSRRPGVSAGPAR
jgi:MFS family permease